MPEYISPISMDALSNLSKELNKNNLIAPEDFVRYQVKRGLRNSDGTGVMAGLTRVCSVEGYYILDGERLPKEGKLIYRGIDIEQIVEGCVREDRFGFEETVWLLLFGSLPTEQQLAALNEVLAECRALPDDFIEDMIMKAPSADIMNKMARCVLGLYSYDENPDEISLNNVLRQSLQLIAQMPTIMTYAYQVKRRAFYHKTMFLHPIDKSHSTAEFILNALRADRQFTDEEAKLLDLCLILHAEHGGGNNSTFSTRTLTSSGTDTYSAIAAGIGSLKGPKHGGANIKVIRMMEDIMEHVDNPADEGQVADYLGKLVRREAGDRSGLIYGMGHAVYTLSDPRAAILKAQARKLAYDRGFEKEFVTLENVEKMTPEVMKQVKGEGKIMCANVDLYSGLVYKVLQIPQDLLTPMFATSRIAGWCAHRLEELTSGGRIMRPAYKSVTLPQNYVALEERSELVNCGPEMYLPLEERT
ncbi:MAG: citrate/2-methylcitrate synthase [Clostridiales bacterium]|nr:citrate/2-methylcitrate synthase [Clostridiales bacterium]